LERDCFDRGASFYSWTCSIFDGLTLLLYFAVSTWQLTRQDCFSDDDDDVCLLIVGTDSAVDITDL